MLVTENNVTPMKDSSISVLYLHEDTIELVRLEDLLLAGDFLSLFTSKLRTIFKLGFS